MSNINKIFNLFGEEEPQEKKPTVLVDFKNHPIYFILMFKKMISNHLMNRSSILSIIKQADPTSNIDEIQAVGDNICFNKSLEYLNNLNFDDINVSRYIKEQSDKDLLFTIDKAIEFFLGREEYEKCIILKKFQDQVKENLS